MFKQLFLDNIQPCPHALSREKQETVLYSQSRDTLHKSQHWRPSKYLLHESCFTFWNLCLSPPQFVLLLVQSLIDNNSLKLSQNILEKSSFDEVKKVFSNDSDYVSRIRSIARRMHATSYEEV